LKEFVGIGVLSLVKHYVLHAEPTVIKVTPYGFRRYAKQLIVCFDLLLPDKEFSPIPYFFCCRAIELALKAKHLENKSKEEVKRLYSHDLVKAYMGLESDIVLTKDEFDLLHATNDLYKSKEFEYFNVVSAAQAFKNFPDLNKLRELARKIVGH
jgi:hypothetical protein